MLLALFACVEEAPPTPAPAATYTPDAPGPWIAGTFDAEMTGSTGVETKVQVWFPASEADEDLVYYDGLLAGTAREDGEPACDEPRPVLVFSHGSGGMRWQSPFWTEHLATHGWIVVAPDHQGNTYFDDGTIERSEVALRRPVDVADTYDWLLQDPTLSGCVDPDAGYVVAGHSFGGFTTMAVAGAVLDADATAAWCETHDEWLCDDVDTFVETYGQTLFDLTDPRVTAAVAWAPAGYELLIGGLEDIAVPTMVLGGTLDIYTPMATQVTPIYDALTTSPRLLGELDGAGHFVFSIACELVDNFDECDPPYLPAEDLQPTITTVSTAFVMWSQGDEAAADWLPDGYAGWTWTEER